MTLRAAYFDEVCQFFTSGIRPPIPRFNRCNRQGGAAAPPSIMAVWKGRTFGICAIRPIRRTTSNLKTRHWARETVLPSPGFGTQAPHRGQNVGVANSARGQFARIFNRFGKSMRPTRQKTWKILKIRGLRQKKNPGHYSGVFKNKHLKLTTLLKILRWTTTSN
jgi:hypothetical protein